MTNYRWLSLMVALAFYLLAIGTAWSGNPSWPLPIVWAAACFAAGTLNIAYVLRPGRHLLEASTAAWIVVAFGRVIGYMLAGDYDTPAMLNLGGVWVIGIVCAIYRYVYRRRLHG